MNIRSTIISYAFLLGIFAGLTYYILDDLKIELFTPLLSRFYWFSGGVGIIAAITWFAGLFPDIQAFVNVKRAAFFTGCFASICMGFTIGVLFYARWHG